MELNHVTDGHLLKCPATIIVGNAVAQVLVRVTAGPVNMCSHSFQTDGFFFTCSGLGSSGPSGYSLYFGIGVVLGSKDDRPDTEPMTHRSPRGPILVRSTIYTIHHEQRDSTYSGVVTDIATRDGPWVTGVLSLFALALKYCTPQRKKH